MTDKQELNNTKNNTALSSQSTETIASSSLSLNLNETDSYAAVDLGSNSFHLVISRYEHGEFTVVDRKKEVVRLASGLDEDNNLSDEVATRALGCLKQFGQLLRVIPSSNVRVVGTNALRRLSNSRDFLVQAENALGHSVDIIAGREEARLIYLGVSKWSSHGDESRLVIDIGGGSTEIIAGRADTAHRRESLEVGCVVLNKQFFADGALTKERFDQAKLAAELAIQPVVNQFRLQGWSQVIGCSGTMKSIASSINSNGLSNEGITKAGLQKLLEMAIDAGHVDKLKIAGLSADRTPVFGGGLSIVLALFELFDIEKMSVSDIALREGVLYDLVGRLSASGDTRDIAVNAMTRRWAVDVGHADQVCQTAVDLYRQVSRSWDIVTPLFESVIVWAAKLHEVGLSVSHDSYHKHGAYLVENADMAGFAKRDQVLLATLVAGHRRKFPLGLFEDLSSNLVTPAKRIAVLLRLAVLLHRGRAGLTCDNIKAKADGQQISIQFSDGWLNSNPLTGADLKQEQAWLKNIGLKLSFK